MLPHYSKLKDDTKKFLHEKFANLNHILQVPTFFLVLFLWHDFTYFLYAIKNINEGYCSKKKRKLSMRYRYVTRCDKSFPVTLLYFFSKNLSGLSFKRKELVKKSFFLLELQKKRLKYIFRGQCIHFLQRLFVHFSSIFWEPFYANLVTVILFSRRRYSRRDYQIFFRQLK